MSDRVLYTIGHSVHPMRNFLNLLHAHGVTGVADVRTVPRSRRHPHFSREQLEASLAADRIEYRHFASLGGLRKPKRNSTNGGWRHEGFRGYADHMQTAEFNAAVADLLAFSADRVVAVMCAEAKWWQCHRQLIADALVARGVEVRHIMTIREAPLHEVTSFARLEGSSVTYPSLV